MITIAVFFIFQLMAFNFSFTGGSSGLQLAVPELAGGRPTTRPSTTSRSPSRPASIAIAWLVRRSRFGLQLRAIRDDEDRARGLGVKAMRVKLTAFVISGAITAMIGAVWFYYINQVEPQTGFDPLFDLTLVLMAFLGGYGSIAGAVLGALIIEPLTLWLNTQPRVQRRLAAARSCSARSSSSWCSSCRAASSRPAASSSRRSGREARAAVIPATTISGRPGRAVARSRSVSSGGAR